MIDILIGAVLGLVAVLTLVAAFMVVAAAGDGMWLLALFFALTAAIGVLILNHYTGN